jgi:hypothetical protein
MASRLKINLDQLGLTLTKGETYRVAMDENVVFKTGSPIRLPNVSNDNIVEWTASGFSVQSMTLTTEVGNRIKMSFDEDVFVHDDGDYIAATYFEPNYITGVLGTIELYGDDSVLIDSWQFPQDIQQFFTNGFIVESSTALPDDSSSLYITIPEDLFADVFRVTNNAINDFDFIYEVGPVVTASASISSIATISYNTGLTNFAVDRDYLSNQSNNVFASDAISGFVSSANYRIQVSCTNGEFWKVGQTPSSSITVDGTGSQISSLLGDWSYHPPLDSTANDSTSIKILIELDSEYVLLESTTFDMEYAGAGSVDTTYTFTTDTTYIPLYEEVKYQEFRDIVVVGAGGGAGARAGGGGGMAVIAAPSTQFTTNTSYPVVVGTGGTADTTFDGNNSSTDGGDSTFFGLTAKGGQLGYSTYVYNGSTTTWYVKGGDSYFGNGTGAYSTYFGWGPDSGTQSGQKSGAAAFYNGPGAGAGGAPATNDSRGDGILYNINQPTPGGTIYGYGGPDANDTTTTNINYTKSPGEGGSAAGYYDNSYQPSPGEDGIVLLRIRGHT